MTIKQHGGIFGRNPEFNTIGGTLTTAAQPNVTSLGTQTSNLAFDSGNGIDFSATSGTGTSELLDDYEEGEWTPGYGMTSGGSFTSITYNAVRLGGWYVKIGRLVYISGYIATDSVSVNVDGNLVINGLPFTSASAAGLPGFSERYPVTVGEVINWTSNSPFGGYGFAGSTIMFLRYRSASDGHGSSVQGSDLANTTSDNEVAFSAAYLTD